MRQNKNEVRRLTKRLLDKYAVNEVTPAAIKNILGAEGYTVIRFSARELSSETARLFEVLGVKETASREYAFTVRTHSHRIVFVRKEVSDEEFLYLLLLELGRVLFVQTTAEDVLRGTPAEEEKAAEFAYRLEEVRKRGLLYSYFAFYPFGSMLLSSLAVLAVIALIFKSLLLPLLLAEEPLFEETEGNATEQIQTTGQALPVTSSVANEQVPDTSSASAFAQDTGTVSAVDTSSASESSTASSSSSVSSNIEAETTTGAVYYATSGGKKYHKAGCSYINGKTVIGLTEAEAQSKYEPCSRCFK